MFRNFQTLVALGSEGAWCLICAEQSWKVRWDFMVKVSVCRSCHLVLIAEFYMQPMQFIYQWCHVISLTFLQKCVFVCALCTHVIVAEIASPCAKLGVIATPVWKHSWQGTVCQGTLVCNPYKNSNIFIPLPVTKLGNGSILESPVCLPVHLSACVTNFVQRIFF